MGNMSMEEYEAVLCQVAALHAERAEILKQAPALADKAHATLHAHVEPSSPASPRSLRAASPAPTPCTLSHAQLPSTLESIAASRRLWRLAGEKAEAGAGSAGDGGRLGSERRVCG